MRTLLVALVLPLALYADATYQYTGTPFTVFTIFPAAFPAPPGLPAEFTEVQASFELYNPVPNNNLPFVVPASDLEDWVITADGYRGDFTWFLAEANQPPSSPFPPPISMSLGLTANVNGQITAWSFGVDDTDCAELCGISSSSPIGDSAVEDQTYGYVETLAHRVYVPALLRRSVA